MMPMKIESSENFQKKKFFKMALFEFHKNYENKNFFIVHLYLPKLLSAKLFLPRDAHKQNII